MDVVSTNYMMTCYQRKRAKYIIDNYNLTDFYPHGNCRTGKWEAVVTAICFYVMKTEGRGKGMRYNTDFTISVGLTEKIYGVVSENLGRLSDSYNGWNTYYIVEEQKSEAKTDAK